MTMMITCNLHFFQLLGYIGLISPKRDIEKMPHCLCRYVRVTAAMQYILYWGYEVRVQLTGLRVCLNVVRWAQDRSDAVRSHTAFTDSTDQTVSKFLSLRNWT